MTVSQRERSELRSMIRARFKALRAGVEQRRTEQHADIERQINLRYQEQDEAYRQATAEAVRIVGQANLAINTLFAPVVGDHPEYGAFARLASSDPPDLGRSLIRKRAGLEVDATAKKALANLAAAEADALEAVARTAIESEDAQRLMATMPSLELLMPMVELPAAGADTVAEMADPLMPWRESYSARTRIEGWKAAQAALPSGEQAP